MTNRRGIGTTGRAIIVGLVIFLTMNYITNSIGDSIPVGMNLPARSNALNELLVVDGILFAFLGVIANLDYERLRRTFAPDNRTGDTPRRARSMLRGDMIILFILTAALIVTIAGVLIPDSSTINPPLFLGFSFLLTMNGVTFTLLRLMLTTLF